MLVYPISLALVVLGFMRVSPCDSHQNAYRDIKSLCQKSKLLLACCSIKQLIKPKSMHKCSYRTVLFLSTLLLIMSLDIESNPGPTLVPEFIGDTSTVYPCGTCEQPVTASSKGAQCEFCFILYHADCQGMSDSLCDRLGDDSRIGAWKCIACNNMNITLPSSASLESYESPNRFSSFNSSTTDTSIDEHVNTSDNIHPVTSTPKGNKQTSHKPKQNPKNKVRRPLKVLTINCRSIVDKKLDYDNMIASTQPDIVLGTESWLKPKHYDNEIFSPELGYTPFRRDRQKQTGGGVFIAVKNSLIAQEATHLHTDCENIWVKIQLQGSKPLLVCSYYKPKEHDPHSTNEFNKSLSMATKTSATVWVGGDFNMPKMDWSNISPTPDCKLQSHYRDFINILFDNNITQMVQDPTRGNHILDLFLTNNPSRVNRAQVIPGISDHDAVLVVINTSARMKTQKPRKIHLYKKADWDGLRSHITNLHESLSKSKKYISDSVADLWQSISSSIEEGVNTFIPSKMSSTKNKLPWIKVELKRLFRKRDKAFRKYKKSKQTTHKEHYLKLKHLCRKQTKIEYQKYLGDILNVNTSNSDEQQPETKPNNKKIYSLLKHSRQDSVGIDSLKKHNKLHTADTDKATILNEQFQSVFTPKSPVSLKSLAEMKVQDMADTGRETSHPTFSSHDPMPDIDISVNGVEKLLKNLNPHKAAGPDQIRPIVLKNTCKEMAPILCELFKKSLQTSTLPDIWKMANVAPIYKKGTKSDPANYRPISLTCILCKTLEHIVSSSVTKHFTQANLFYELQHGFREKRSCQTQLLMLIDDILKSINQRSQVDLILLDFSKAFDMVNHEKLLYKLHYYGIRGQTLSWIKSFLDNRSQSVVVNGSKSSTIPVSSGVPQGSVLGPLLFLIYINDLPDFVKHSKVRLFADDTALYLSLTVSSHSSLLQQDLHQLEQWESKWEMKFNPSKCQVIQITKRKLVISTKYRLHNTFLETVSSAKYLGVTISSDLNFNKHIDNISKKASQTLGFLRRNIKVHSERLKSTAYKTLVRPQLEYSSTIWSPYTAVLIDQLESVQRRAARWAKQDYGRTSSVTEMLNSLNWRRLDLRRIDQRLVMFHNILHNQVAIQAENYLTPNTRSSRTSHSQAFRQIQTVTDYHKYSFFPRTIVHWNALPPDIVTLSGPQFSLAVSRIEHVSP